MKDLTLKQAEAIAGIHFGIETLQSRNRDALDFHDVSVRGIYSALNNAYKLGQSVIKFRYPPLHGTGKKPKKKAVKKDATPWSMGII